VEVIGNHLVNGLTRGAEYALIAAGLALIFGVLQIVNFAHGEFYMIGAYAMYVAYAFLGLPYPVAALTALLFMVVFGALFYWLVLYRIIGIGWQVQLVATIAASLFLANLVLVWAGALPQYVPSPLTSVVFSVGEVNFSAQRVVVLAFALVAFAFLYLMLTYTKQGKAMRALSQNREACVVLGIPEHRVGLTAVLVGSLLAGVASVTIPPLGLVSHDMGVFPTLKAFAAVIMGGFGNVTGAIVSAFILGVVEALGAGYISSEYGNAIVFGIMILALLTRPHGLFGRAARQ
jgi:branched-chain amino acid transport system permease protein